MKKKLEADLISIAHRILKLKNKSELVQLHQETQKLYEKLSVLRFVDENFGDIKPTIGQAEINEKIEAFFNDEELVVEIKTAEIFSVPAPLAVVIAENPETEQSESSQENSEEIPEMAVSNEEETEEGSEMDVNIPQEETFIESIQVDLSDDSEDEAISFKPAFELNLDLGSGQEKEENTNTSPQITFEDLLGSSYVDPIFVKPEDLKKEQEQKADVSIFTENFQVPVSKKEDFKDSESETPSGSLNDRISKGITIGLNDRIAFINHLFGYSTEDYNRVLSQLITIDTFEEAKLFIDEMVKPDYNNWENKEDYAQRFMEIIEKKFS